MSNAIRDGQDRLTTLAEGIWLDGRYHRPLTPKTCKRSCPEWGMCK